MMTGGGDEKKTEWRKRKSIKKRVDSVEKQKSEQKA